VKGAGTGLLGPAEIRELADQLAIRPAKRLGQNFVIDAGTIRKIVALAGVNSADVVLEVGPGLGSLTLGLLGAARRVTAVEIDPALAAQLPVTVAARVPDLAARLTVLTGDAVTVSELRRCPDPA
jgi:16S rRNA (adenine1518-N6/adenine1519-N6)-dimethyltransferase